MALDAQFTAGLQIFLAIFLSMVIGLNRQGQRQPAGLRTHMLVGAGAALFTILSKHAFPGSESARVAAQIIPGIGFLGAGTILQRKGDIHHLTTAASIWATAAVGMAVGTGVWLLAIMSTLAIWVILALMRSFEDKPDYIVPKNKKNGQVDPAYAVLGAARDDLQQSTNGAMPTLQPTQSSFQTE